jgi:4-diphosphocytidyl-2-C-methyl-D-erythritol kinase
VESIEVRCNAKINLYLRVLDRRADGFHDIETVFHSISLYDTLTVTRKDSGLHVTSTDPGVPLGDTNLALRAAARLAEGARCGLEIAIDKHIPVGAGLGGGSADAAGALVGVNALLGLNRSTEELEVMAADIGADVKFMLRGGCAVGRGRGDDLSTLACLPPLTIVLVAPPLNVDTGWAYDSLKRGLTTHESTLTMVTSALGKGEVTTLCDLLYNDFEGLIFGNYPFVGEIKEDMLRCGADGALMTGSGPVVYGIFSEAGDARLSREKFLNKGYRTIITGFSELGVTVPI